MNPSEADRQEAHLQRLAERLRDEPVRILLCRRYRLQMARHILNARHSRAPELTVWTEEQSIIVTVKGDGDSTCFMIQTELANVLVPVLELEYAVKEILP